MATADAWRDGRIVFAPVEEVYRGFHSIVRHAITHATPDTFRLRTEIDVGGGAFVAMDEEVYRRRR